MIGILSSLTMGVVLSMTGLYITTIGIIIRRLPKAGHMHEGDSLWVVQIGALLFAVGVIILLWIFVTLKYDIRM